MLFLLQIVLSVAVAIATVHRPQWACGTVLVLAALLPFEVVRTSLGTSWHPATTLALAMVLIELVRNTRAVGRTVGRHLVVVSMLVTFFVIAVSTSWFTGRAGEIGTLVLQLIAPVLLFVTIRSRAEEHPGLPVFLARMLVVITSGEALLIVGIWTGVLPQPWLSTLEGLRWWVDGYERMLGTFEHPLVCALWMSAAVPLSASLRTRWLRIATPVLLIVGIALTGSRFALFAAVVASAVLIFRSHTPALVKVVTVVLAALGMAYFSGSAAASLITGRLEDDGGSAAARLRSAGLAVAQWDETFVIGRGFGASEHVTRNALIGTSFENPFLMFSIDFGLVATILFFAAIVALLVRRPGDGTGAVPGARLAGLLTMASILGFNSLSTNTPIGVLLFTILALLPRAPERPVVAGGAPSSARTTLPTPARAAER